VQAGQCIDRYSSGVPGIAKGRVPIEQGNDGWQVTPDYCLPEFLRVKVGFLGFGGFAGFRCCYESRAGYLENRSSACHGFQSAAKRRGVQDMPY